MYNNQDKSKISLEEIYAQDKQLEQAIVNRIEQLLKDRNMSKYRLSQITGIAQASLSTIFNGKNAPSLITINRICVGLGISYSDFFDFNTEHQYALSAEDLQVLNLWHKLNNTQRKMTLAFAYGLEAQSKATKL